MALYLVAYDLRSDAAKSKEAALVEAIKASANGWWHHLPGFWLIGSAGTPKGIVDRLTPVIADASDSKKIMPEASLFVAQVTKPYYGWLPKDAWDWLEKSGIS